MALVNCELVTKTADYFDAKDYGANPCSCDFKELLWQHMRYTLCGSDYPVPCDSVECEEITVVSCNEASVDEESIFQSGCTKATITQYL